MAKKLTPISWEAQEYIVRDHNGIWYLGLAVVSLALGALAVWLQAWTFLALIIVSIVTILIYVLRPPRTLKYHIDNEGLTEGNTLHKYDNFRAFGIQEEGDHYSAILIPKKRFGISVKVYFPEGSGEPIVDFLGGHLPMEEVKPDLLDKLINFLRI